jgi:hypothetical protein
MKSPGHKVHVGSGLVACRKCHGSRVHGVIEPESVCAECHPDQVAGRVDMTMLHCDTCHNFLDQSRTILPSRKDCQACHLARNIEVPEFAKDGHMATLPCWSCHEPHSTDDPGARCAACHVDLAKKVPRHPKLGKSACVDCHKPHTFEAREK